ncbi:hypothetical protein J5N97_002869 [Dioscorea zingiberensis]|uniref:Uncharacterized protein n=1 Tax=Dioscorea zingiberensis TaxID=325984 RepID=A0A9D5HPW2_9LILI|nr:hypothetical protein J5N97_002869 [Dioscorea zingiberensis]
MVQPGHRRCLRTEGAEALETDPLVAWRGVGGVAVRIASLARNAAVGDAAFFPPKHAQRCISGDASLAAGSFTQPAIVGEKDYLTAASSVWFHHNPLDPTLFQDQQHEELRLKFILHHHVQGFQMRKDKELADNNRANIRASSVPRPWVFLLSPVLIKMNSERSWMYARLKDGLLNPDFYRVRKEVSSNEVWVRTILLSMDFPWGI